MDWQKTYKLKEISKLMFSPRMLVNFIDFKALRKNNFSLHIRLKIFPYLKNLFE